MNPLTDDAYIAVVEFCMLLDYIIVIHYAHTSYY